MRKSACNGRRIGYNARHTEGKQVKGKKMKQTGVNHEQQRQQRRIRS